MFAMDPVYYKIFYVARIFLLVIIRGWQRRIHNLNSEVLAKHQECPKVFSADIDPLPIVGEWIRLYGFNSNYEWRDPLATYVANKASPRHYYRISDLWVVGVKFLTVTFLR